MKEGARTEEHDVLENPSPNVELCFKMSEEMKFDAPSFMQHGYCDEIKRGRALNGDDFTFVKSGAFGFSDC